MNIKIFIDPRGRTGKTEYARAFGLSLLASAPFLTLLAFDGVPPHIRQAALVPLWLIAAAMWVASVRWAHDGDHDWRQWLYIGGGPTLLLIFWVTLPAFWVISPWILAPILSIGIFGCLLIGYGLIHDTDGSQPNRYGPPTLRPKAKARRRKATAAEARPPP